jgi:hypothetical protein
MDWDLKKCLTAQVVNHHCPVCWVLQERVSLAAGGYVGVRRVVRLLEHGDNAKRIVDAVIDANAQMLNLRVAIMRCAEWQLR